MFYFNIFFVCIFLIHVCANMTYAMEGNSNNIVFSATRKRKHDSAESVPKKRSKKEYISHQSSAAFLNASGLCQMLLKSTPKDDETTVLDTPFSANTLKHIEKAAQIIENNHGNNTLEAQQQLYEFIKTKSLKKICNFLKAADFFNNEDMQIAAAQAIGNYVHATASLPNLYKQTYKTLSTVPAHLFFSIMEHAPRIRGMFEKQPTTLTIEPETNFDIKNPVFFTNNDELWIVPSDDIFKYDIARKQVMLNSVIRNVSTDFLAVSPDRSYAIFSMVPLAMQTTKYVTLAINLLANKDKRFVQDILPHVSPPVVGAISNSGHVVLRQQVNDPADDILEWKKSVGVFSLASGHPEIKTYDLGIQPKNLSFINENRCFIANNTGDILILNIEDGTKQSETLPIKNAHFRHISTPPNLLITDDKNNRTIVREWETKKVLAGFQAYDLKMSAVRGNSLISLQHNTVIRDLRSNLIVNTWAKLPQADYIDVSSDGALVVETNNNTGKIIDLRYPFKVFDAQSLLDLNIKYHEKMSGALPASNL